MTKVPIAPEEQEGQKRKKVVIFLKEKMEFVTRKDEYKKTIWIHHVVLNNIRF